jgi:patatin-like phospholipase/acyl hydrolase
MKKVRILSIDGGGIRGVIPAVILEHIENKLKEKSGNANAVLQDYFDMIAGTSTGGILTCFYLHPSRFPAKKAIELYVDNGKKIFDPKLPLLNSVLGLVSAKYAVKGLEKALSDTFGNTRLSQVTKHSLITAYDIVNRKSVLFTVPEAKTNAPKKDFYLKDIARATSAAPTYFEPAAIKSWGNDLHNLIDGGMFANDPSLCALIEARKTEFEKFNRPTIKDIYLVSVGTGNDAQALNPKKASGWGVAGWASPVIDILMSASPEVVSYQLKQLFDVAGCSDCYLRLNPALLKASAEMDDVSAKNIDNLKEAGKDFISKNAGKLDKIAEELVAMG